MSIKRRRSRSPLYKLKYPEGTENIIYHQQYNHSDTSMPKKAHYKVKDAYNDMEEKSQDNKQNYQTDDGPHPWNDI